MINASVVRAVAKRQLLMELRRELSTTLVVVTHDRMLAELADEMLIIEDGKIVQ